ncbi:unnamed protein product, partial [Choristocarpus tenellus]
PIPAAPNEISKVTSFQVINSVGFSSNRLSFLYYPQPMFVGVSPDHGPTCGGTRVTVSGLHFEDYGRIACLFGGVDVTGVWISSTSVECTTPAAQNGVAMEVSLYVSMNGLHFGSYTSTMTNSLMYRYVEPAIVSFLSPTSGLPLSSQREGDEGGKVTVYGANFVEGISLVCRFGAILTAATYISTSEVQCQIPPMSNGTGAKPRVSISTNGIDFSREGFSSTIFTYYIAPEVLGLSPTLGPSTGGTVITI